MDICLNCGREVTHESRLCLHCRSLMILNTVWPSEANIADTTPALGEGEFSALREGKFIANSPWGDFILGFIACWPILGFSVLALVIIPCVFFASLKDYPTFALGFALGAVAIVFAFFIFVLPSVEC